MKKDNILCTKKNKHINLKRTKKKILDGGSSIKQQNFIYLDRVCKTLQFKIPNSSFKANLNEDPNKHKNIELFEHQQLFMDSLLSKYTGVQTYKRIDGHNFFINSGEAKVFYRSSGTDLSRFSLKRDESFKTNLFEHLYIETDVNNNIFFKIVFKKDESLLSNHIAPFILIIYPKDSNLNIYLYTLLKSPNMSEDEMSYASDNSTIANSTAKVVPKSDEDKLQVDLIKKISWEDYMISNKTDKKHGDEISEYLINCSDWLGDKGKRSIDSFNTFGSDFNVKRVLKSMSESWKKEYLRFPTNGQDPYWGSIKNSSDQQSVKKMFDEIQAYMNPKIWKDPDSIIERDKLSDIINIIRDSKFGGYAEHYNESLIKELEKYSDKDDDENLTRSSHGLNPLFQCHQNISNNHFASHLIGTRLYFKRVFNSTSETRPFPKITPQTDMEDLKSLADSDLDVDISDLSQNNHTLIKNTGKTDHFDYFLGKEGFDKNDLPKKAVPFMSGYEETGADYNKPTYYDIVDDTSYTFGDTSNSGVVMRGVNEAIKDDNIIRAGLTPFINIEENSKSRFPLSDDKDWVTYYNDRSEKKASYLWSGRMGYRTESEKEGDERKSCFRAKKENYYETLESFKNISEEFYNSEKSYFLFPHVQDFISLNSLVDLKYINPPNFQSLMTINRDIVTVSKSSFADFKNVDDDFWKKNGSSQYGVCQGSVPLKSMETNFRYVLNERFILGHSLENSVITMNNVVEIKSGNLKGGVPIKESEDLKSWLDDDTSGMRGRDSDAGEEVINSSSLELIVKYNIRSFKKRNNRASEVLSTILKKLGLINIPMVMKIKDNYDFLVMVYLLGSSLSSFEGSNSEFHNFFNFYKESIISPQDEMILDNQFLPDLSRYLQTFGDINLEYANDNIRVPTEYKGLDIVNVYNSDKKSDVFVRSLFENIINYRKHVGLDDFIQVDKPEILSFMESLMTYEENPHLTSIEILSLLKGKVDFTLVDFFDSVGNLQGGINNIEKIFSTLSDYLKVPIYVNIVGFNNSKLLYSNISNNKKLPLIFFLEEISEGKYVSRISSFVDEPKNPKIFYESIPYEELRPYSKLVIEDIENKRELNNIFKRLSLHLSNNIVCTNQFNLNKNDQIIISSKQKCDKLEEIVNETSKDILIQNILSILFFINETISDGEIRYLIDGEESNSDIYSLHPVNIEEANSWSLHKRKILSSINDSSCFLVLEFMAKGNRYKFTIAFLRDLGPDDVLTGYIDMVKRMMLIEERGDNVFIDEDALNMNDLENKSSLLMNGLLLGYNKSVLETKYESDILSDFSLCDLLKLILLRKDEMDISILTSIFCLSINPEVFKDYIDEGKLLEPTKVLFGGLVAAGARILAPTLKDKLTKFVAAIKESTFSGLREDFVKMMSGLSPSHIGVIFAALALGTGFYYMRRKLRMEALDNMFTLGTLINKINDDDEFKKLKRERKESEMMTLIDKKLGEIFTSKEKKNEFEGTPIKFHSLDELLFVMNVDNDNILKKDKNFNSVIKGLMEKSNLVSPKKIFMISKKKEEIESIRNLFLNEQYNFENLDLLNYIYTRILEGDIKSRYIGKKIKIIKNESHFSDNFLNIMGYVIDYNYKLGEYKIRISLPWGSETLVNYAVKKKGLDLENKDNWEKIEKMAINARELLQKGLKEKKSKNSEKIFIELMLSYSKDDDDVKRALEMFSNYNFILKVKNRSSLILLNDKSTQLGGRLTLELALDMFRDRDFSDINYKLLIDFYNRRSSVKIFLIFISDLGKIHNVYPMITNEDKVRTSDEIRFISINKERIRKILAFKCSNVGTTLDNIKIRSSTSIRYLAPTDDINIGFDYFVVNGNRVSDRVTVIKMVYSSGDTNINEKSYMVESTINPKTTYVVNSSDLISEISFEYNRDKFLYSDEIGKLMNRSGQVKSESSRAETERQLSIGIIERINSKFDKFTGIFDSLDTLFAHNLDSVDSKEFLNKFISNSLSALDDLNSKINKSKLLDMYSSRLMSIESRIQSFYNKHREVLESEDFNEDYEESVKSSGTGINDEDDYQGMIALRYEQSKKLSIDMFKDKMRSLMRLQEINGVSDEMMTLYQKVCLFIVMNNELFMGNQKVKTERLEDLTFYRDLSPFEISVSEFVDPTRGEFVFRYVEYMLGDLKSRLEGTKDNLEKKNVIENAIKKLKKLCEDIEKINPGVKLKEEKKKNEEKEKKKKDDGKKKFLIDSDNFKFDNNDLKKSFLTLKKKMRIYLNDNTIEEIHENDILEFTVDDGKELINSAEWKNFYKKLKTQNNENIINLKNRKNKVKSGNREEIIKCKYGGNEVIKIELLEDS